MDQVQNVAKGRIWSGEEAIERGLVDRLGGFEMAVRLARVEAGMAADAEVKLAVFPRPKSLLELLFECLPDNGQARVQTWAARKVFTRFRPLLQIARQIGLIGDAGVLRLPPFEDGW